jgi:hypothetical protein
MNSHRLVVDEKLIEEDFRGTPPKYQLFHQMTRITRERDCIAHDDRIEAVAGAVAYWVESRGLSPDKSAKRKSERALEDSVKGFLTGILGKVIQPLGPGGRQKARKKGRIKIRGR